MFIIKSERRNYMLVDDLKFVYYKHLTNESGTILYWECSQRKKRKCKARLHTKTSTENFDILKYVNEHPAHSSIKDKFGAKKFTQSFNIHGCNVSSIKSSFGIPSHCIFRWNCSLCLSFFLYLSFSVVCAKGKPGLWPQFSVPIVGEFSVGVLKRSYWSSKHQGGDPSQTCFFCDMARPKWPI